MTQKVHLSFDRRIRNREVSAAIQYGGGSPGWIVPAGERLVEGSEGDLPSGDLGTFDYQSSSGFDVTIGPGEALVEGGYIATDETFTVSLASNTNNQTVYIGWQDGLPDTIIVGLDSAFTDNDHQLAVWEFDTDGSGVTASRDRRTLEWTVNPDSVRVDGQDVGDRLFDLAVGLDEARLAAGLAVLDYDDGWIETYENTDLVDTQSSLTTFDGDVTISSGGSGSLTTPTQSLPFVPAEGVIAHTATFTEGPVTVQDEASADYDTPASVTVTSPELIFEGVTRTRSASDSFSGLQDGDTVTVDVGGNVPTDIEVALSTSVNSSNPDVSAVTTTSTYTGNVCVSDDGSTAVVGDFSGNFHVVDLSDPSNPSITKTFDNASGGISGFALSSDGGVGIVKSDNTYILDISDVTSPSISDTLTATGDDVLPQGQAAISTDGTVGIVCGDPGTGNAATVLGMSDINNVTETKASSVFTSSGYGVAMNGAGDRAIVGSFDDGVVLLDTSDPSSPSDTQITNGGDSVNNVSMSADGSVVVWGESDTNTADTLLAADTSDITSPTEYVIDSNDNYLKTAMNDDGTVALARNSTSLYAVDLSSLSSATKTAISGSNSSAHIAINDGGDIGLVGENDGDMYVLEMGDLNNINKVDVSTTGSKALDASLSSSGAVGLVGDLSSDFFLFDMTSSVDNPSFEIDGKTASTGSLSSGETYTETLTDISSGSQTGTAGANSGSFNADLSYTETTKTIDPQLTIDSDDGTQTVSHTGTLNDGEAVDLSGSVDASKIGGSTTLTVGLNDPSLGPAAETLIEYRHTGINAGGFIQYVLSDGNGNSVYIPVDSATDVSTLTSSDVTLSLDFYDVFGDVSTNDYAAYFQQ